MDANDINEQQLTLLSELMRAMSVEIKKQSDLVSTSGMKAVTTSNWQSGFRGLVLLQRFVCGITDVIGQQELNRLFDELAATVGNVDAKVAEKSAKYVPTKRKGKNEV